MFSWNVYFIWLRHGFEYFLLLLLKELRCTIRWGCGLVRSRSSHGEGHACFLIVPDWLIWHHLSLACSWHLFARLREQGMMAQLPLQLDKYVILVHQMTRIGSFFCLCALDGKLPVFNQVVVSWLWLTTATCLICAFPILRDMDSF